MLYVSTKANTESLQVSVVIVTSVKIQQLARRKLYGKMGVTGSAEDVIIHQNRAMTLVPS
jgi:hypothetical protein